MEKEKKLEEEIDELEEEEEKEEHKSHKFLNFLIVLVLLIIGLVMYSKYVGTKGLIVKEYRVESNILTENFSGLKIVHFSDLIYKSTVDSKDLEKIVKSINKLKPDIIVFTGDLVTNNVKISYKDSELLISELSKLDAKIGKYAIFGDKDFSYTEYTKVMDKSGFTILNNSYEEILYNSSDPLYIVGLPSSIKENTNLETAFDFYDELDRRFTIVLVHDGNTIKSLDESNYEVDMILGGHSLNGSVVIPKYGGIIKEKNTYKYSGPEYQKGITKIFISSGIGTNEYGYRLFTAFTKIPRGDKRHSYAVF